MGWVTRQRWDCKVSERIIVKKENRRKLAYCVQYELPWEHQIKLECTTWKWVAYPGKLNVTLTIPETPFSLFSTAVTLLREPSCRLCCITPNEKGSSASRVQTTPTVSPSENLLCWMEKPISRAKTEERRDSMILGFVSSLILCNAADGRV